MVNHCSASTLFGNENVLFTSEQEFHAIATLLCLKHFKTSPLQHIAQFLLNSPHQKYLILQNYVKMVY
jgi:hypothetical protein